MKFIISTSLLSKHLQAIQSVINPNSVLPILGNFLFEINKGILTISASDLETSVKTALSVEAKENGLIAIPSRILLETLKTFAEQPLTFTITPVTYGVEISSDNGKYKLAGENGEDFPIVPKPEYVASVSMSSKILSEAINKTLFAVGNDDLRRAMNGVYCQFQENSITFVSTDAHKLVKYKNTDVVALEPASFIIPKKALTVIKSLIAAETSDALVKIEYNKSNAFFTFNNIHLICRLIEEKFPDYEAVFPDKNPNKLFINRNSFLNSVRRISIFSSKSTHLIKLKITANELQISAQDIDFASEANERIKCSYVGEEIEIGFNAKFLVEMLSNLDTDEVVLELSQPNRAGILAPSSQNKNEEILMLVMPVMLHAYADTLEA